MDMKWWEERSLTAIAVTSAIALVWSTAVGVVFWVWGSVVVVAAGARPVIWVGVSVAAIDVSIPS